MAGSRLIKNRIRSTKNIEQITKAMEAVSAVKMRKAELIALSARPYALSAIEILRNLLDGITKADLAEHTFLRERKVKRVCLVVVTSDKGLAGSFNSNVVRKSVEVIKNFSAPVDIIAIGKKGRDFFARRNANIVGQFFESGDFVNVAETLPISEKIVKLYQDEAIDEVVIVYTNFLSALKQEVIVRKLLPFSVAALEDIVAHLVPEHGQYSGLPKSFSREKAQGEDFLFEPSPNVVLDRLLPDLLEIEIYNCILEANASEHSSRMVAMKNASQNADELIDGLTIQYNKMRQSQITKELIEITAGSEALNS